MRTISSVAYLTMYVCLLCTIFRGDAISTPAPTSHDGSGDSSDITSESTFTTLSFTSGDTFTSNATYASPGSQNYINSSATSKENRRYILFVALLPLAIILLTNKLA
ncbi:pr119.3 [rat cytomegalovirus strain Maastricht]|uniref:Pr119.3 n=1 Tax=Rat cytomegalovirus (strain Maastricht) TaxID=79700 RepID=Q9DW78_RCMVM|nr:pr119.3 [rat cytomegalovirus strain Maastricht]AAF99212.1 pr119.3 [rat cytomegalovirus strain Maastricht]WEG72034.1 membrane protein m119.3 [Murid betaherpesvirus 2]